MQRIFAVRVMVLAMLPAGSVSLADITQLDDVLVVSPRVERSLTEVPASISVVDAEAIEDNRAENLGDVVRTIPNVYLQDIPGDYTYFQVRGLPRNLEQPNLPVYVDGVPYTSLYGLNISMLNVEQVELVRGPQGNLYGSNARDGVLSITTREPSNTAEWSGRIGAGNNNYRNFRLAGNAPLIEEQLYGSLAIDQRNRDGFVHNTALGKDVDDIDELSVRGSLTWQPTDTFSARLTLDAQDRDNGAYSYVAGSPALSRGDDMQVAMDIPNVLDQEVHGVALNTDWDLTSSWTLSSVTGMRKVDTYARFDADLSTQPFGYFDTWLEEEDLFQELRLASHPYEGDIDWLFGLSYFNNQDANRNAYPIMTSQINADMERDSWTGYANATWRFAPAWTLEGGLRYTEESLDITSRYANPLMPLPTAVTSGTSSHDYDRWLPKAALSWEFRDHQTLYLSYGKGLLSGGGTWLKEDTNTNGMRKGIPVIYAPELSSNLELGYKAWFPSSQTSLNLAVFQMDIEDYQHFYPDSQLQTRVASIDRIRSQGVEASVTTRLWDNLQAMFSISYNKAEVDEIDGVSGATALSAFQAGDRIPGAPKYNINLQLTHDMALNSDWQMRTTFNGSYFGNSIFDNGGALKQDSYPVIDLNTRFVFRDKWSVRLWAKNLTDERYQIYRVKYGTSDVASYGQPRTIGIDLIREF